MRIVGVTGGVDTHADNHMAAAVDQNGGVLPRQRSLSSTAPLSAPQQKQPDSHRSNTTEFTTLIGVPSTKAKI